MIKMNRIGRSLALRIAGPLAVLVLVLGALLYFLVLTTISGFVQNEIKRDLESLSHRVYNICNISFEDILQAGLTDDQDTLIIKQALTLGRFEDFFRQENLEGVVYKLKSGELILETTLPLSSEKIIAESKPHGEVISLATEEKDYFAYHFDFSPWDWQIIIIKSKGEYSDLITQVQHVHIYTLGLLILTTFLLIFFLYHSIKRPINAIINPIKNGQKPEYKGINVFEFLSDTIAIMMDSLKEKEEKYRSLIETTSDFVWEIDQHFIYNYASPAIKDILGYTPKELVGKKLFDLMAPDEEERVKTIFLDIMASKMPIKSLEIECRQKNGQHVILETSGVPILDTDGYLLGYRGIDRDITERIRTEEEKSRLKAQLLQAQKMEAIGTLAGGVAHDLNNILSGIVSYPELLLMDIPQDSPYIEPIRTIKKSGERAAAIVQDLLTLARRGVSVEEIVNLNNTISEYFKSPEYKQLQSFHPKVEIETKLETKLLNISGSSMHLSKTIMNMVSNATEAILDGGKVLVSTENRYIDSPIGRYENIEEGDYVVLKVRDNGSGIAHKDLDRIFEPFFTKKVMGRSGTGLGMAVVWGTIRDHRGYIDVQSIEGKGTTFLLYFPVTRKESTKGKSLLSTENYMGKGETILVVDDREEQREIASGMLRKLNYSVTSVASGEEAVDSLKDNAVDLLVLDMIMAPGIDGLDTYKQILELHPKQKAIIASGFSETDRVKEIQKLGAKKYVKKPYTMENIGLAVKEELIK